jgi:hypothetical protein
MMLLRDIKNLEVQEQSVREATQDFIDAGFSVETVNDSVTVYSRPVSHDVREASRILSRRTIGYRSPDIPSRSVELTD